MAKFVVEIARQHQLEGQPVGSAGVAHANACFDIYDLAVVIHHRPDLVDCWLTETKSRSGPKPEY
jgi:hypothetical protein